MSYIYLYYRPGATRCSELKVLIIDKLPPFREPRPKNSSFVAAKLWKSRRDESQTTYSLHYIDDLHKHRVVYAGHRDARDP